MANAKRSAWILVSATLVVPMTACKESDGGSASSTDGGGSGSGGGGSGGMGGGSSTGGGSGAGGSSGTGGSSGASGSSGAGGSTGFVAATPPADVCALLTLADVQTILPAATAGAVEPTQDPPDLWTRTCKWSVAAGISSVELVLFGALNQTGLQALTIMATTGPGNGTKTPVSGLGDRAIYWEDSGINTRGLTAMKGSYSADVTAYFVDPAPTQAQLTPLVQKALDQL